MGERFSSSRTEPPNHARLRGRGDFDPDLYDDACARLDAQEASCETRERRLALQHAWFRDAYFPQDTETELERMTAIPPYRLLDREDLLLSHEPPFIQGTSPGNFAFERVSCRLYGGRVFTCIKSGIVARVPEHLTDILGTGELDCCQGFVGIRTDGTLCLAHLPGPGPFFATEFLPRLLGDPGLRAACFLYPELPTDGYRDPSSARQALEANERFAELAKRFAVPAIPFPSSSVPGDRIPEVTGLRTLVTATGEGVCVSLNKERVARGTAGRVLRYEPLKTKALPWEGL